MSVRVSSIKIGLVVLPTSNFAVDLDAMVKQGLIISGIISSLQEVVLLSAIKFSIITPLINKEFIRDLIINTMVLRNSLFKDGSN